MKKLILLLALALGVEVKGQIVGGYLPRNSSTSTATIGTIRTNSLVVTASTISVGAKTLTAGNTGTVAVLSDVIFGINHAYITNNFANNQSYILDEQPSSVKTTGSTRNYLPKNTTITQYNASIFVQGTPGSGGSTGTLVLQVNGVNTNTLTTGLTFTSGINTFSSTLTQTVSSGSYLSTLLITPNFTTNPTNVQPTINYWCKPTN